MDLQDFIEVRKGTESSSGGGGGLLSLSSEQEFHSVRDSEGFTITRTEKHSKNKKLLGNESDFTINLSELTGKEMAV